MTGFLIFTGEQEEVTKEMSDYFHNYAEIKFVQMAITRRTKSVSDDNGGRDFEIEYDYYHVLVVFGD